ncbi:hypothetical protein ACFQ2T_12720 [Methylophilus flavus]|uniref:Uncharacterized protein n=1 Tax=Methylophilus flavus TaxID=640084 RepID=A0ABW3PIU1_9PROT
MQGNFKSPYYTGDWAELLEAR